MFIYVFILLSINFRGSVHFDENPRVFEVPEHNNFDGADADSDGGK